MALYGRELHLAARTFLDAINTKSSRQPLEHSEDKVDQALSVMKFQQLAEECNDVSIHALVGSVFIFSRLCFLPHTRNLSTSHTKNCLISSPSLLRIIRLSLTDSVDIHIATKFLIERTHQRRKNSWKSTRAGDLMIYPSSFCHLINNIEFKNKQYNVEHWTFRSW